MMHFYDKRAFVLVTAILVLSILAILCLAIAYWTRIQLAEQQYYTSERELNRCVDNMIIGVVNLIQKGEHLSYAGNYKVLNDMPWFNESPTIKAQLRIDDIEGRISVNHANRLLIKTVIKEIQGDDVSAAQLIDAIEDWRGTALNPKFNLVYESKMPAYQARNAPLKRIEELLFVSGVSQELFYGNLHAPLIGGQSDKAATEMSSENLFSRGLYDYLNALPKAKLSINGMLPHVWRVVLLCALFDHPEAAVPIIRDTLAWRFGMDGVMGTEDDRYFESREALAKQLGLHGETIVQRLDEWLGLTWQAREFDIRIWVSLEGTPFTREAVLQVFSDDSGDFSLRHFAYVE